MIEPDPSRNILLRLRVQINLNQVYQSTTLMFGPEVLGLYEFAGINGPPGLPLEEASIKLADHELSLQ